MRLHYKLAVKEYHINKFKIFEKISCEIEYIDVVRVRGIHK